MHNEIEKSIDKFLNEKMNRYEKMHFCHEKTPRTVLTESEGKLAEINLIRRIQILKMARNRKLTILVHNKKECPELEFFKISTFEHYYSNLRWHLKNIHCVLNGKNVHEDTKHSDYYNELFSFFKNEKNKEDFFVSGNYLIYKFVRNMSYVSSMINRKFGEMIMFGSTSPFDSLEVPNMINENILRNFSDNKNVLLNPWILDAEFVKWDGDYNNLITPYCFLLPAFDHLLSRFYAVLDAKNIKSTKLNDKGMEIPIDDVYSLVSNGNEQDVVLKDMGAVIEVLTDSFMPLNKVIDVIKNQNIVEMYSISTILDKILTHVHLRNGKILISYEGNDESKTLQF